MKYVQQFRGTHGVEDLVWSTSIWWREAIAAYLYKLEKKYCLGICLFYRNSSSLFILSLLKEEKHRRWCCYTFACFSYTFYLSRQRFLVLARFFLFHQSKRVRSHCKYVTHVLVDHFFLFKKLNLNTCTISGTNEGFTISCIPLFLLFILNFAFSCRNESSFVDLQLLDLNHRKTNEAIFNRHYILQAMIAGPDGEISFQKLFLILMCSVFKIQKCI